MDSRPWQVRKGPEGMQVEIYLKDKKNSSGRLVGDRAVLSISSKLKGAEREDHIRRLSTALAKRRRQLAAWATDEQDSPELLPSHSVTAHTDEELAKLALAINRRHYNFPVHTIRFARQTSLWGSCMPDKRQIHVSHRLRGGPYRLLEYIIVHELCHLQEPNHGQRFWQLVAKVCPDHRERRKELEIYGWQLAQQTAGKEKNNAR